MIDLDIYCPNPYVEKFLESLKIKLIKDYSPINVYISTTNPYKHWSQKLYNIYDHTELMEVSE
jgi:hypothetical protein